MASVIFFYSFSVVVDFKNAFYSVGNCIFVPRVLEEVQFHEKFEKLPQFNPDLSETGTPLPKSPRDIVNSYRKKRKQSVGNGPSSSVFLK